MLFLFVILLAFTGILASLLDIHILGSTTYGVCVEFLDFSWLPISEEWKDAHIVFIIPLSLLVYPPFHICCTINRNCSGFACYIVLWLVEGSLYYQCIVIIYCSTSQSINSVDYN